MPADGGSRQAAASSAQDAEQTVETAHGMKISFRRLSVLDKLRLFKAAGPTLSQNEPWLGLAVLAYSVTSIDGIPVPTPCNEAQIESLVGRLGEAGIAEVARAFRNSPVPSVQEAVANAGN
ncbi:MAG: hypothetical protein JSR21_00065 [Proteobacteria bacterium]|nr:hypothetical protein [Pseudomonadota bacterium]